MSQTLTNLIYHVVFSTKNRINLLTPEISLELYPYVGGILNGENGKLIQIGGTPNHVHILCKIHPSSSVSDMLRHIKGNSSKWLHEKGVCFAWQKGYGAFSVSESAANAVRKYIIDQKRHHENRTFESEYLALLKKHNVQFDEKYIWD
jgi:REP element-mobilizing transposase RayT